jgi:hypothetical protein
MIASADRDFISQVTWPCRNLRLSGPDNWMYARGSIMVIGQESVGYLWIVSYNTALTQLLITYE